MVDVGIFGVLLECAYDIDILNYQESKTVISKRVDLDTLKVVREKVTKSCYMLTSDGDLEITESYIVELDNGKLNPSYEAQFKSNLRSISDSDIHSIIQTQLETEAFLYHNNPEEIRCVCEKIDS